MPNRSSHFDDSGQARMVDVSSKPVTVRIAVAIGVVTMRSETAEMIRQGEHHKGDVLGVARLAGIQATKLTQQLIPLCHAIPVESVEVDFHWLDDNPNEGPPLESPASDVREGAEGNHKGLARLSCRTRVVTSAKTGVEMEAMTAASIACLTIYDMAKSVDREMLIGPIRLLEKSGGKSGHFRTEPDT